jgi:glycosyltransferase involved in cell wall biosynthesis
MANIALVMIVKNEAKLIERCLDSALPLIDYVSIDDTGSTDDTKEIIRQWLDRHDISGDVFDKPWQDFGTNRTIALQRLRAHTEIDYALMLDADDTLVCAAGFDPAVFKEGLSADLYHVAIRLGGIRYHRPQLWRNALPFHYRGVVHEFLVSPQGATIGTAAGLCIVAGVDGARSVDPDKYRKDAELLSDALATEEDAFLRARYTFYLANSLKDCGETEAALGQYLARAKLGFWDEEIFVSLWRAAQMMEALDYHSHKIIGMYLRAWEAFPQRAEALHGAARYCRAHDMHQQGYLFAKAGSRIRQPASGLFVEPWIYDYGLLDELSVTAYWIGRYGQSFMACQRLLGMALPAETHARIEINARFAKERLM